MMGRRFLGLLVLLVGLGFLLDAMGLIEFGVLAGRWWPVLLIAAGLLQMATRSAPPVVSLGLIVVGAVLLADRLGYVPGNLWSYIWPVVLILIGLAWLLGGRQWRRRRSYSTHHGGHAHGARAGTIHVVPDAQVRMSAAFGGYEAVSRAAPFRGGQLTAVFGGVKLDLREAQLPPEGADLEATAVFGGVEILVPTNWRVETRGMPILGGFDDKTASASAGANAPVLRVRGSAFFGGLSIHHGKGVNPPYMPRPITGA